MSTLEGRKERVFALTGGIGSGKSTVAALFRKEGLTVVDADKLARQVVEPGSEGLREVAQEFGSAVLLSDGSLDRAALARRVFSDPGARARLNAVVHPRVQSAAQAAFEAAFARGESLVCYEIPLLFETGQEGRFRPVVVVTTSLEAQLRRISARDRLSEEEARARIAAQMPLSEKARRADVLIENDSDLPALVARAEAALGQVRKMVREG